MFPSLPITPFSFLTAIGFVLASFLFWRNLKNDFPEEEILSLTCWLAIGGILGARIVYALFQPQFFLQQPLALFFWSKYGGFSLLGAFAGIFLILAIFARRKKWDVWQVLDQLAIMSLMVFVFGAVGSCLTNKEILNLVLAGAGVFCLLAKKLWLTNYRSFAFYPSGKIGFIGLSLIIIFFSLLLPLDFYKKNGLSWENLGNLIIVLILNKSNT